MMSSLWKQMVCGAAALALCFLPSAVSQVRTADNAHVSVNDVTWNTLGKNENDSMPIGNGDLAANAWTEQNGDLVLLVAKADAWSELGKLLKLGRVRVQLSPNPFTGSDGFKQVLHLEDGRIEIRSGTNAVWVWVDANHPVIHVQAQLEHPATLQAKLELWRTEEHSYNEPSPDKGGIFEFGNHDVPVKFEPDTVMPAAANRVAWYHYNTQSVYPLVLEQEHLQSVAGKYPDPLLHRIFGAELTGADLTAVDDHTLRSASPRRDVRLDLVALTEPGAASPEAWKSHLDTLAQGIEQDRGGAALAAHQRWWHDFWDRSWIHVAGSPDADAVSQGYIMQRYMIAASSRGAYPTKFNGGLFTVGHDMLKDQQSTPQNHNPDFRQWGNPYWNQNNRLLYWPLLMTGDFDLIRPWFDMYLKALPLAEDRARIYFHHGGALIPETTLFWGLPSLNDFGWDNPTTEMKSQWQRYHIQGTLEVIAQMLDEYDITRDTGFAREDIVRFADPILTYYNEHWPRTADGKLRFSPTQSLETYQINAVNPTPDIAGIRDVIPRLLALPDGVVTASERAAWTKLLHDLPPIPTGTTAKGKLPGVARTEPNDTLSDGKGDPDGRPTILPAEQYGKTRNGENPELYVAFPYRLYGVGKPDLKLAQDTFAARLFPQDTCWGQDGPQAAVLGLTASAKKAAIDEFKDYGDQRFPWFWKAGHDWIPDLDNGGTGMMTLELMLMQTDGRKITLLPAWPEDWTADFKLHAPYQTTVEGHVEGGRVTHLVVTPKSRTGDVTVWGSKMH